MMAERTITAVETQGGEAWKSCFRNDLFAGKVALVSGGGRGLGRAIATELAALGCRHVVIASRKASQCQEAAKEINQQVRNLRRQAGGERSTGLVVVAGPSTNIRNAEQVSQLVAFVVQTCGALDLLVNNAGGQFLSPAEDISPRGFQSVVETNLVGTFLMCREAYNQYMKHKGGAIVNITLGNRNGTRRGDPLGLGFRLAYPLGLL